MSTSSVAAQQVVRRAIRQNWPLRMQALHKGRLVTIVGHESEDSPQHKPLIIKFAEPRPGDPDHALPLELEPLS